MKLSYEDAYMLVAYMLKPENRKFPDDTPKIAAGRVIFVKWMKECGEWNNYKHYIRFEAYSDYVERAWKHPKHITDFLGETSYDYNVYDRWYHLCDEIESKLREAYYKLTLT